VRDSRTADNGVMDWLHEIQRREGRADLSFASLLPGSLPVWSPGPLTLRQVWAFYPYENTLVTVRATGRQVREALEAAGRCISGISTQDGQPVWKRNPSVFGYNCDTMDGAEYALDPTRPEGKRLLFLRRGGRPVSDDDVLTVAINSYRAAGGGGYSVWKKCPRVDESDRSLRDLLVEDARKRKMLDPRTNENWFLAPSLPEGRFGDSN
ncbi:MAG: 5'-nucleotidase C-terminal domain-containing protein, partial [Acidobacteriota bacterium]|nr:5'-nucleotidase C-terminal domain-containing protein [Acidobacteriota bacterium]